MLAWPDAGTSSVAVEDHGKPATTGLEKDVDWADVIVFNAAIRFKKGIPEEVHIEDVKQKDGQWLVAGTSGEVLVVVGMGSTMRAAQAQAYGRVRNQTAARPSLPDQQPGPVRVTTSWPSTTRDLPAPSDSSA